ncbi:MAG: hypothetical protein JNK04_09075, partial [Myxococcales bacterium]|nr:hypothetical protein [Myxococcales bacterium]
MKRFSLALVPLSLACSSSTPPADQPPPPPAHTMASLSLPPPSDVLPPELAKLVDELAPNSPNNQAVAQQIAASNNDLAKKRGGAKLALIAAELGGKGARDGIERDIVQSNQRLGRTASPMQLEEQVAEAQTEKLAPIYLAMGELGGDFAIDHCFKVARDVGLPLKRRSLALGVIERYVPPTDALRGKERVTLGEEINKKLAASQQSNAQLADAAEVVARFQGEFRKCYDAELKRKPTTGKIDGKLTLKVDTTGAVTNAAVTDIESKELTTCVLDVAKRGKFSPPAQATE